VFLDANKASPPPPPPPPSSSRSEGDEGEIDFTLPTAKVYVTVFSTDTD
jgi:hypothetical protein